MSAFTFFRRLILSSSLLSRRPCYSASPIQSIVIRQFAVRRLFLLSLSIRQDEFDTLLFELLAQLVSFLLAFDRLGQLDVIKLDEEAVVEHREQLLDLLIKLEGVVTPVESIERGLARALDHRFNDLLGFLDIIDV